MLKTSIPCYTIVLYPETEIHSESQKCRFAENRLYARGVSMEQYPLIKVFEGNDKLIYSMAYAYPDKVTQYAQKFIGNGLLLGMD
jgi:hypothetical protein